ncbi:SUF system NifU family Fe-S cluster assembly protein [Saxibacter everestensis]|uniref:SUF system NifU family Fe-S cluster assembly protein n=1 Tax=Saxibacter everestensis TaxID=2909229 RepID=A0ABY8QZV9_9MICO|nr:SUF system NifU family Fe-S cluster assembly protein [Brevibacteriaceae bacterium ZFBP1038]
MSASLEQLYQQVILDHSKARHGNQEFAADLASRRLSGTTMEDGVGSSHQINPTCGDEITVEVRFDPETGIEETRWDGRGCSISMASASVLTSLAEESDLESLARIQDAFRELMHSRGKLDADEELLGDAAAFQGVSRYPARIKCAMLAWTAFEDALRQARLTKD